MMKKLLIVGMSLILATGFFGCTKDVESCPIAVPSRDVEEISPEKISDMLGQGIYDALAKEWEAWNAKNEEQKLFSSHLPGHCYKSFNSWAECENFLGFSLFNPLENDSWPKKATYVGMPLEYLDAARFYVSFYGPDAEQVQWVDVQSGYRDGDIRITLNAQISVDIPKENIDKEECRITEDSGEKYVAVNALLARGPVTYSIRVIGKKGEWDEPRKTMEKILLYFEEE